MIKVQFTSPILGNTSEEWDPEVPEELDQMREWFIEKLEAGFRICAFSGNEPGILLAKFDENAERIILNSDRIIMTHLIRGG